MASKFTSPRSCNNKMTLLSQILTDKCLQNHSALHHLTHPIEKCISETKVCSVEFAKVLRPIKLASNIGMNEKTLILDIRKRFNNRNAAGAFRKRETDTDKVTETEISKLRSVKNNLTTELKELSQEIYFYRSMSLCNPPIPQEYTTDSDSEINITSPIASEFTQTRSFSESSVFN